MTTNNLTETDLVDRLSSLIKDQLLLHNSTIKESKADKWSKKYVNVIVGELIQGLKFKSSDIDSIQFRKKEVQKAMGLVVIDRKDHWLFHYFTNAGINLVQTIQLGFTGFNSRVKITERYKEMLLDLIALKIGSQVVRVSPELVEETIAAANRLIPVNRQSLCDYIERSREQALTSTGNYKNTIIDGIARATDLLQLIVTDETGEYLPEAYFTADTGREYGRGFSLQCQPKLIRHAALGHCHQYDFQAHSFAVMTSLARMIAANSGQTIQTSAIEDYVRYRSRIRQQISTETGIVVDKIKSIFTSLGFGARISASPYTAIRGQVTEEQFELLINNRTFGYIVEELRAVQDLIADHFPATGFDGELGFRYEPVDAEGHKRNRSQRLAWIYQNLETYTRVKFQDYVRSQTGQEPLLTVHDGVYYLQPIPAEVLVDAQVMLRDEFELVRIEHTPIWPITTNAGYANRHAELDQEQLDHQQRMREQERIARGYQPVAVACDSAEAPVVGTALEDQAAARLIDQIKWSAYATARAAELE